MKASVLHFTPSDYLADFRTKRLDLCEHGAYNLLLWHMWTASDSQCEFPLDYRALASIWGVCPEEAERITDSLTAPRIAVVKVKTKRSGAVLFSKRLYEQANRAKSFRDAQSEKGKRSGAVRREKALNPGSTPVQPLLNQADEPSEPHVSRNTYLVARAACTPAREAAFEECYSVYPIHRFREKAYAAWYAAVEAGADPADLLTACRKAKKDTTQTLEFFITDGTWRDRIKKRTRKKACTNPACENGFVLPEDSDTAVPCPDCGGTS